MASFQKSQDIDLISLRTILAKGTNNSIIPVDSILVTDGRGGTKWTSITSINTGITFNTFETTPSTFTSATGKTTFSILDGDNAGLVPANTGNSVKMYAKAFGKIDVEGVSSIYSFNTLTGLINSNVKLVGTGIINISTDTTQNKIMFYSPNDATSSLSTVVGNFTGLNTYLSTSIPSFRSPFSTFIYDAISSFSTAQGPIVKLSVMSTEFSSFSTLQGPVVTFPQLFSAFSTFSTVLGPTVQLPQLFSAFSTFSTVLGPTVQLPQLFSTFSTFSTVLGPTVTRNDTNGSFYIGNLNTSSLTISGSRQPYIQYGSNTLNATGSRTISLSPAYINTGYNIQLSYAAGSVAPSLSIPLCSLNIAGGAFDVVGNPSTNFYWTTYGNIF